LLVLRTDFHGLRIAAFPDLGVETRPGDQAGPADMAGPLAAE
jgi:hypothetical protein